MVVRLRGSLCSLVDLVLFMAARNVQEIVLNYSRSDGITTGHCRGKWIFRARARNEKIRVFKLSQFSVPFKCFVCVYII